MNSEIENKEAKKNNESEASIKFNEIKKEWTRLRGLGFNNDHLSVRESPGKGLGVFANKKIKQGEAIEYCHAIVLDWKRKYVHDQSIIKYAYWHNCACNDCQIHGNSGMILLGNGSIYNSAESDASQNAIFDLYPSLHLAIFKSLKDIQKDEEILVWWGQSYYNSWCKSK